MITLLILRITSAQRNKSFYSIRPLRSFNTPKNLSLETNALSNCHLEPLLERQIKCESTAVVEKRMMSTRSQDPSGSDEGPQTLVAKESPVVRIRKRKARHEADVHSRRDHMKRMRTAAATENDTGRIDSISSDVNGPTRIDTNGERPGDGGNDGIIKYAVKVADVEAEGPKQSVKSKDSQTDRTSNSETRNHSENEVVTIEATKAIHRRFGSEDLESQPPQLDSNIAPEIQTQQASGEKIPFSRDEASEDEAPETVTAAASFKRARAAAASTAKIIERYCDLDIFDFWVVMSNIQQKRSSNKTETQRARCTPQSAS